MLGLFANPVTAHDKYSLLERGNLLQHFQMQFSEDEKHSLNFFFAFSNFRFKFNHFQTKMTLIAEVFFSLRTPKIVVR